MRKKLTDAEQKELDELLAEDILDRYNHSEYWEQWIIEEFYADCGVEL